MDEKKVEYCVECQKRMNEYWDYCPCCGIKIMTVDEFEEYRHRDEFAEKHISHNMRSHKIIAYGTESSDDELHLELFFDTLEDRKSFEKWLESEKNE